MTDYDALDQVEDVARETRSTFDLGARLRGRTALTKTVTVFTDEALGEAHQEAQKRLGVIGEGAFGLRTFADSLEEMGFENEAAYLRGRADEYVVDEEAYNAAEAEEERLREELLASALTFKLHGVPEIAVKKANQDARSALKVKGKIPEERQEEFDEYVTALLLSRMVTAVKDHATGSVNDGITVDEAKALPNYLPPSENVKIMQAAMELRSKEHFSGGIADEVDF